MKSNLEQIKVNSVVIGILDNLYHFQYITENIFSKHNLSAKNRDEFINLKDWLGVQNDIKDIFGPAMLFYIGKMTFQNAKWPKDIKDLSQALPLVDVAYHQTHSKGEIGHYLFEKLDANTFLLNVKTPYVEEFNLGLISGLCDVLAPKKLKPIITIHKESKANNIYKDNNIYKIQLIKYSKKIDIRQTPKWVNDKDILTDELLKESFLVMNGYINKFQNAQELLEEQVYKDQLTNLDNRFKLTLYRNTIFKQLIRDREVINIAMFDIDFFKQYNDKYGHTQGDIILKEIANIVLENINRPYDLAVRYGGEELLLFLPCTDNISANNIVENIRKEVGHLKSKITISAGLVHKRVQLNDDLYDLIDLADKLMYEAKNSGKNRVISYEY